MRDFFFALEGWPTGNGFRYPRAGILRAADADEARVLLAEFLRQHGYPERADQYRVDAVTDMPVNHTGVVVLVMGG